MRNSTCSLSLIIISFLLASLNFNAASDIELVEEMDADSFGYQNAFQGTNKQYCQEWNRTNEKIESLLKESKTLKSSLQELRVENTKNMVKDESKQQICDLKVELEKMRCMSETSKRQNLHQQALNAAENLARVAQNETAWLMTERTRELEHHVSELKGEIKALRDTSNTTWLLDELRVMQVSAAEEISRRTTPQQTDGTLAVYVEDIKKLKLETQELKHKLATTKEVMCRAIKSRDLIELDGSYYYFSDPKLNKLSWNSAKMACRAQGLELVTIDSLAEQRRIYFYLVEKKLNSEHWYIGASDIAKEGEFIWVSSGQPVQFTYWKKDEPNNLKEIEHCSHIHAHHPGIENGEWNDVPCLRNFSYICELQMCTDVLDH